MKIWLFAFMLPVVGYSQVSAKKPKANVSEAYKECKEDEQQLYFKLNRLKNKYGQNVCCGEVGRTYQEYRKKQAKCNKLK